MQFSNTKKLTGGLVLAIVLVLAAAVGFAQQKDDGQGQRGGWGEHGGFGFFARDLNLSDQQKEQLKQIAANYRESTKNLREQLRNLHQNGFDPLSGGTFDEATVRSQAQARANLEVELEVARARMMSQMYSVLTADQKAQLAQQRQQWEQKRQERRARRGATTGQPQ